MATTFINTSLPALKNIFSFHPTNFFPSFSLMSLKVFLLFLPTSEGRPEYFSCCFITWAPNLLLISSWTSPEVVLLKNKDVLAWFSCWSEVCSYTFNTHYSDSHSAREALQNIKLSLAKERWESFFFFFFFFFYYYYYYFFFFYDLQNIQLWIEMNKAT